MSSNLYNWSSQSSGQYTLVNPNGKSVPWDSNSQSLTIMGDGQERMRINSDATITFPQSNVTVDLERLQAMVEILLEFATPEAKMAIDVLYRAK